MEKMNEKKISSAVLNAKSIKEITQFAGQILSDVLGAPELVSKIAAVITDPAFVAAESPLDWLLPKVESVIINHLSESVKQPMTKIQLGFSLAMLANLTVGDVVDSKSLEAEHE